MQTTQQDSSFQRIESQQQLWQQKAIRKILNKLKKIFWWKINDLIQNPNLQVFYINAKKNMNNQNNLLMN